MTWFVQAGNESAATAVHAESIILVEIAFTSGTLRLHTRQGNLSWNSQTWLGVGQFGGIGEVSEDAELRPSGLRLVLSGIDSSIVSAAATEDYRGKAVKVYQGFLNVASLALVADPEVVFSGVIDTLTVEHGGGTGSVTLTAENELARWQQPRALYYTSESQALLYSGDKGFDQVPHIQQKNIDWTTKGPWGRPPDPPRRRVPGG